MRYESIRGELSLPALQELGQNCFGIPEKGAEWAFDACGYPVLDRVPRGWQPEAAPVLPAADPVRPVVQPLPVPTGRRRTARVANRATTSFTLVGHSADFTLSVLIRRV